MNKIEKYAFNADTHKPTCKRDEVSARFNDVTI